jgi:hypothetical protein
MEVNRLRSGRRSAIAWRAIGKREIPQSRPGMPNNDPQKIGVAAYGRRHAGPSADGRRSCRRHDPARPCRAFSPVRPQGRTGAADVVRPAPAEVLGSGKIADQNREMPFDD